MITQLDTQSWSQELVTGNGEFVAVPNPLTANGELYVVSNVRTSGFGFGNSFGNQFSNVNSFAVLKSTPVPPAPGPGASFFTAATYVFNEANTDFDPVAAYDPANGLIHIIGTRNTPTPLPPPFPPPTASGSSSQLSDLVKFTFDTATNTLTGPVVLTTGSRIRGSYDIGVLPNSDYIVGVCLADPILATASITGVSIAGGVITVSITLPAGVPAYSPGQWLLLDGLTVSSFLNGALLQVVTATTTQITALLPSGGGFGYNFGFYFGGAVVSEPSGGTATPVGESLLAQERVGATDALVPGSGTILDSSPSRTGNSFDAVSIVVSSVSGFGFGYQFGSSFGQGLEVDLYYQYHPKNITFQDQIFTIAQFSWSNGGWGDAAEVLTTFSGRWADDRLTVLEDTEGNRYLSQTYWTQLNHPEGIVGNAFLGYQAFGGTWSFHPTFGTTVGGSIIQGTLSIDSNLAVSYLYLLQPFDQIPAPPSAIAWPLHAASVAIPSLNLTEVPGSYNGLNLTWIRGTKSLVDDQSEWAIVGETEETVLPLAPTTVPVYVSLFNVPPVAEVVPTSVTLWRNNTFYATDVAAVTSFSVAGDVVTVTVSNDFAVGQQVAIYGFQNPPNGFLNGVTLTVLTASPTQFTAEFAHPNYTYQPLGSGFGMNFGSGFGGADMGFAAVLIPGPLFLDASGSVSPSLDPLAFTWTENYPGPNVTITPSVSGTTAELSVSDAVGGPGFTFDAGVAVTDTVSPHPPANATSIQLTGNVVSFTVNNLPDMLPLLPFAPGELVMPYGLAAVYGFGLGFGFQFGDAYSNALEFLNDQVLTVLGTPAPTATTFSAIVAPPSGFPAGPVPVTGFIMPEFQFAQTVVTVPTNVAPTVAFPSPAWGGGFGVNFGVAFGMPDVSAARNSTVVITPLLPTPVGQYPVVYTGVTDPDDSVAYLWQQTSGTPVATPGGVTGPGITIDTAGASILGETLTFEVTVNDGVNLPASASFSIVVPAYAFLQGRDTLQLSRSIWGQGGFGINFGYNFGGSAAPISMRNTAQAWSPLDISVMYTDLQEVKRVSVLDGSDRYVVISPYSVMVYGIYPSTNPTAVLLRVLFTPGGTLIQDAVHTEQDYTLVLDAGGNIYRYSSAPNIYTDAPDATIVLSGITTLSFVDAELDNDTHILTTQSFLDQRVLVVSGEPGALLLQVATDTLVPSGFLELTTADHFLYGADKAQFVRWVGMESLSTGDVLLGTVANNTAEVTNVAVAAGMYNGLPVGDNTLLVACANTFRPGDVVVLSGATAAPTSPVNVRGFLNGLYVTVVAASATAFTAYWNTAHAPQLPPSYTYGPAPETGVAVSQNSGATYESLISLVNKAVIGTWDKSKLKNQFVQTGEILFDPDTTYPGRPIPPLLGTPSFSLSGANANISLSWQQQRTDLVSGYTVQVGTDTVLSASVPATAPYTFQVPVSLYFFAADTGVVDNTVVPTGFGYLFGGGFGEASSTNELEFVPYTPGPGQYTVSPTGLYQFNAAQAGDSVNVSFVQLFRPVATVVSGAVTSVVVQLPAGPTYLFQVQANSLDGASGYSNIQEITT